MDFELLMEGTCKEEQLETFTKLLKHLGEHQQFKVEDYGDMILMHLCPQGVLKCQYEESFVRIETNTIFAGPGYHHAALELMKEIQEESHFELSISDSTNYLEHQDFDLLTSYFYEWMHDVREYVEEYRHYNKNIMISWNEDFLPKRKSEHIITALGYVSYDDLMLIEDESLADRLFIWNQIEQDASFYRNCALSLLWNHCYFEYTNMNEIVKQDGQEIIDRLEIAYEKNQEIAIPMHAYQELCQLLHHEPMIQVAHKLDETEPLGYRRHELGYRFHNWIIWADGTCEKQYDEISDTFILMGPYLNEDAIWNWMLRVNVSNEENASLKEFESILNKDLTIHYQVQNQDGYYVLDAQVTYKQEHLLIQFIYHDQAFLQEAIKILEMIDYEKEKLIKTQA